MRTIVEKINEQNFHDVLSKAAEIIKSGGLVAFPTETVYGLGADALNPDATKKIYLAKGRPSDNPLIVHIYSVEQLNKIARDIPMLAYKLIEAFWPGPLTIIFNKQDIIPQQTSGGLKTVAVRFPMNCVAQKLIEYSGVPIAAPSANLSGTPSTTKSFHVINDLFGRVDMIIDDDDSSYGLESTIIDLTTEIPTLLRPGAITNEMLREIIGEIIVGKDNVENSPKAPGMKYKHYSPKANVFIVDGKLNEMPNKINKLISESKVSCKGIMATAQTKDRYDKKNIIISVGDRNHPESIAENLFATLRKFDELGAEEVYVESIECIGIGQAIMNRLRKAAGYKIIKI